ncbi:MAG: archaetidylserine decarboxylase [Gammaproteobacteria bacterium]
MSVLPQADPPPTPSAPYPAQPGLPARLATWAQYLLPQHALSALVRGLARMRQPALKDAVIDAFMRRYRIDLAEAECRDPRAFESFNAFFTRALVPGARPLPPDPYTIASPVDGAISQIGRCGDGLILQAKSMHYTVEDLLADAHLAREFKDAAYATLYLSPRDYHRIHMPVDGQLRDWWHVPGSLFAVNRAATHLIPRVFARNERVVCVFDTRFGPMAVILVGALFVGSMDTVWATGIGQGPAPPAGQVDLARGAELGRFNMGSTVILLFQGPRIRWLPELKPECTIRMGQALATASAAR